jgi:hypothetical protein
MSFLMWEYQGVDVGRFHDAKTATKRTQMITKGYADITGLQSWAVPYPTGKGKKPVTPPAPEPKPPTYSIASSVDATDPMKWSFVASPTGQAGTYKFGDGTPNANALTGEIAYTYAAAGTYTVTFIPVDGAKAATTSITVVAPE